ncbi:hypothetical protein Tco_0997435 [Tanacetum coccineum]
MINNGEEADQDDQMIQKERELLASLIEQLKVEIDASKQTNKSFESSNKVLKEANTFLQSKLTREYYYADYMNAILGVYTTLDEHSDLTCNYLETLEKCKRLENELSKRTKNVKNKSFKSSVVSIADAPDKCQQQNITPSTSTTVATDMSPLIISTQTKPNIQAATQVPTVTATENND